MADVFVSRPGFRDLAVQYVDLGGVPQRWAEKVVAVTTTGADIAGGGGGGGGPADVGVTTAASETDATRQKVTTALRLLDTAQAAGSQLVAAKGDQTTGLWVNVKNASIAVTLGAAVDVSDRAARLVGVVYGSQGQQLKQTATNFNLQAELAVGGTLIDPRSIRALVSSDVVTAVQATPANLQATVTPAGATVWDVSDRAGRALGVVASITAAVDVSDRAARLLGVVYGSQAQQLKQTATNFNQQVEVFVGGTAIDPRSIRTLTTTDAVTATTNADTTIGGTVAPAKGLLVLGKTNDVTPQYQPIPLTGGGANVNTRALLAAIDNVAVPSMAAATLHVTATGAANAAVTATLPAAGAGLFHYITSVQLVKLYSLVGVAAGAGVIVTSTNLPGNPAWTTEQLASAAGTAILVINYEPTTPLKSSVANTATTFVAPAQTQTIWRWNISYFTGV